jgi:catechol 2,3-dioxygenase-like lactoylglutathione lyase family enzyme
MRFNKDYIAETLAAYASGAAEEARRLVGIRGSDMISGLESATDRNSRETNSEPFATPRLRDQKPVGRYAIRLAILLLILLIGNSAATPAQPSLQTAEGRTPSASYSFVSEVAALRPATAGVTSVDVVALTVADADAEAAFFTTVLSFEKVSDVEVAGENYEHLEGVFGLRMRVVRIRLGAEFIELTEYLVPRGRAIPTESRSNDRWFQHVAIITADMDRAYEWLRKNKVQHASSGPQRLPDWNKNAGGIKAFYFKDPEGHVLEVLQFPEGKGDPKWHRESNKLFLGIDHTAIVVGDTDASLAFYRDALGMRVAGESENYGTEQEHLNNVFGARLRITALRAPSGPGIELLEYLAPRDGRPYPQDARANDLCAWQTRLLVPDADQTAEILQRQKYPFVSSGVVAISAAEMDARRCFIVRDPDGHLMQLSEK